MKPEQEYSYNVLQNETGDILIVIKAREGVPDKPVIIYDGKEHALLYRDKSHTIILDFIHPDARSLIVKSDEVLIAEFENEDYVREYNTPIRMVKLIPLAEENYPVRQ